LVLSAGASNDWYKIIVRPVQHDSPMPRPDGRNIYESPDLDPVPTAPCIETLRAITVPPGSRYDAVDLPGPETIIVVAGTAAVHVGGEIRQLSGGQATLVQAGQSLSIVNQGSASLQVLDFAVTPLSGAAKAP
jgi:hypothetical protein